LIFEGMVRLPQTPPSNYNGRCGQSDQTLGSLTVGKGEIFDCALMLDLIIIVLVWVEVPSVVVWECGMEYC
jgi:hypothetical protein